MNSILNMRIIAIAVVVLFVASRRPCIERLHDQTGSSQGLSQLVPLLAW